MKNKSLLLVSANMHTTPYPVFPLGISYIRSYLNEQMPELTIYLFDFIDKSYDEYVQFITSNKPDFIGISLRNIDDVNIYRQESFITHYKNIIELSRKHSDSVIITGGSGFSIYPQLLFDTLKPDFGIYGEGEISLFELIASLIGNKDFKTIEGLLYKESGLTKMNKRSTRFKNPVLHVDETGLNYYWQNSGMLNIQTKRGCPYKCIYCTYPLIEGNKVRTLNTDEVVETLAELYYTHNIDYFFFTDSVFNINNSYNYELAEKLIHKNLNLHWGGYFNFSNLDPDLLGLLKKSGLKHIEFGTESLSDTMLKNYGKPFTVREIFEICRNCNDLEIDFAHFLILGGYGETDETIDETFQNCKKISHTAFFPFIGMRIYPGTKLQQIAIEEKVISKDDNLLEPVYYVSKYVDLSTLKDKAQKTGKRWIFPDEDMSDVMNKMRKKGKKGPLWEYLLT